MSRALTLVLPYYENAGMLREQQRAWAAYPPQLRAALHVIVVDDGSPISAAADVFTPVDGLGSQRLYRTRVDVRWNWLFCRNLGMAEATTDWVLMTDIDHVLPDETLSHLLTAALDQRVVYRFSRLDAPELTPYKPHPNTWLMTRKMFDRIGGYDERFSGYYGTDGEFRDRVEEAAQAVVILPQAMVRFSRDLVPDASTVHYGRKEPQDQVNVRRIRDERANITDWRPLRLTFAWERQR